MKNIKVFISSTFNNLVSERNSIMLALRAVEKYAIEKHVNLKTIDFRWGLPEGGHIMKTCLESINSSMPYFLCILGDKYGSQPQWEDYEKEKGYLEGYNKFIEENVFKSYPVEVLSYTAMEVYFALSHSVDKENIKFIHLSYLNNLDSNQKKLFDYIEEKGYIPTECSTIEDLVAEVKSFLTTIIDKNALTPNIITDNHPSNLHQYPFVGFRGANTQDNQLSLYRKSQEILLNYTIQDTSVRCEETELDDFISSSAKICCIEGDDGTGKSTLLANWLKDRIARELPNETIIYHFYNEGYIDDVFEHLYLELAEINNHYIDDYYAKLFANSDHIPKSFLIFEEAVRQLDTDKNIIIVLDGLEHSVSNFDRFIDTFNNNEKNIRLILTTGYIPVNLSYISKLHLSALSTNEVKNVISKYLRLHNRHPRVADEVAEVLVTNQLLHNPQLLSSVLYDLRAFGNHNNIKDKIAEYSATQEALAVYKVIIKNWEAVMPVILDSKILVWIAYSHYGLAEDDIKRIAGLCEEKENLWHQLFFLIEPYMEWNGDRLQFVDRRLKSAIIDRYKGDESCIKNTMILYFQNINLPIERQYDELPYLYEDMNRMDDLLTYLLNLNVFRYAHTNRHKKDALIKHWSNFELSDFNQYLNVLNNGIEKTEYITTLYELSNFLYFHGIEMFPDEKRYDIESVHLSMCENLISKLDTEVENEIEPSQLVNVYRTVAVSYIDSFRYDEARILLEKGIRLLSPIVGRDWTTYDTTVKFQQIPELQIEDKTTMPLMLALTRTALLKNLNPYIDLLSEIINVATNSNEIDKYYNEVMSWIDILDQVQENSRNTSLLRSTIEYAYGMSLYSAEKYMDAFERFDNSFNLKYDYIQSVDSYGRKDTYQEYRLMELYKMIEACQITVAQSDLYRNQARYVEAVEKYGKELIDIGRFDRERLCNCLFNYAAYFYNQTLDREDDEVKELLHNAHKYYEKVVSETEDSHLNGMYIRASFFNMICLARMGQEENIPKICTSILEKEKELGKYELNDPQIHEILKICHSMSESEN